MIAATKKGVEVSTRRPKPQACVEAVMILNDTPTPLFRIISTCKGGGYRYARTDPPHPKRNKMGLYPLHRVLAENAIGRILERDEVVHHKDGDKNNDSPDNLEVKSNSQHSSDHARRVDSISTSCPQCGLPMSVKPWIYRRKMKTNLTGHVYCSRRCAAIFRHSAGYISGR